MNGQTELRHADICVGDAIIINAKPDGKSVFDEGQGNVLIQISDRIGNKAIIYEDVHWALCYKYEFVVYAWRD